MLRDDPCGLIANHYEWRLDMDGKVRARQPLTEGGDMLFEVGLCKSRPLRRRRVANSMRRIRRRERSCCSLRAWAEKDDAEYGERNKGENSETYHSVELAHGRNSPR